MKWPSIRRHLAAPDLRTTLWLTFFFALINALARRLAGPVLAMDDAKTNLFTQVWQWGYQPDNPPLFEWLLILVGTLTGGGLAAFLVLKYAALIAAAGFMHAAIRLYTDDRTAFLGTMGAVLLYQIGWNFHQAFTHSALLLPAVTAGIWALLRVIAQPTLARFAVLGLAFGVGLLTKYNFLLFALPALLAALSMRESRTRLLRLGLLVVPLIAGVLILPHALWFMGQTDVYRASVEAKLGIDNAPYFSRVGDGLSGLAVAAITFFLPFALIMAGFIRFKLLHAPEHLLVRTGIIGLGLLLLAVLFTGLGDISERYLIPVLLPAYVGIVTAMLRAPGAGRIIGIAALLTAIIVSGLRAVMAAVPGPPFCDDCREFVPYRALAPVISRLAPPGSVLVVREENTGGNLVDMFPGHDVRVFTSLHLTNPVQREGRPCFLVWSEDTVGGVPLEDTFSYAHTDPHTVFVDAPWRHPLRPDGYRRTRWGVTPIVRPDLYAQFCQPTVENASGR